MFVRKGLFGKSWQYVNSMNCIVCVGDGSKDIGAWFGAPSTLSISGLLHGELTPLSSRTPH